MFVDKIYDFLTQAEYDNNFLTLVIFFDYRFV